MCPITAIIGRYSTSRVDEKLAKNRPVRSSQSNIGVCRRLNCMLERSSTKTRLNRILGIAFRCDVNVAYDADDDRSGNKQEQQGPAQDRTRLIFTRGNATPSSRSDEAAFV